MMRRPSVIAKKRDRDWYVEHLLIIKEYEEQVEDRSDHGTRVACSDRIGDPKQILARYHNWRRLQSPSELAYVSAKV